jgi:hypothetical protein
MRDLPNPSMRESSFVLDTAAVMVTCPGALFWGGTTPLSRHQCAKVWPLLATSHEREPFHKADYYHRLQSVKRFFARPCASSLSNRPTNRWLRWC